MHKDLIFRIALQQVPNIGDVFTKALLLEFDSAEDVFKASAKKLGAIEGMGDVRVKSIKSFKDFSGAEKEVDFIEKFKIEPISILDDEYPMRLLNCYDAPAMLYCKGECDLNADKIVAIVGTRSNSDYGRSVTEKLIADLKEENVLIVSGLAYGVDTIAHKAALANELRTLAVLGHGLNTLYPAQNKSLAKDIVKHGALITEFGHSVGPDKQNFPKRNRIVAGMSDAIILVESGKKGGSLITAELGNNYNKDVFAFPGRTTDARSEGCNYLIKNNKAALITCADDLLELMNWKKTSKKPRKQRTLFIDLAPDEKAVFDILNKAESVSIDSLYAQSNLSSSAMAQALLMLEMAGLILSLPGKIYKVVE